MEEDEVFMRKVLVGMLFWFFGMLSVFVFSICIQSCADATNRRVILDKCIENHNVLKICDELDDVGKLRVEKK